MFFQFWLFEDKKHYKIWKRQSGVCHLHCHPPPRHWTNSVPLSQLLFSSGFQCSVQGSSSWANLCKLDSCFLSTDHLSGCGSNKGGTRELMILPKTILWRIKSAFSLNPVSGMLSRKQKGHFTLFTQCFLYLFLPEFPGNKMKIPRRTIEGCWEQSLRHSWRYPEMKKNESPILFSSA